jgi:peptidyl-prolyl cis-trans isomerase SurA
MTKTKTLALTLALVGVVRLADPAWAQAPATIQATPETPAAPTASAGSRAMLERILVRVNGEIFSQGQLTDRQVETLQELKRDAGPQLEAQIAEITPAILVTAVDELLLVQRGREMGFSFSDEQFKSAIDNIKSDNKLDDEGLKVGLAQAGLTLDLLRQRLERSFLVSAVQQREVGRSLSITTEEIRQYYERNKAKFMTPLTVTLRELSVAVPTRTEGGREVFSTADDAVAKAKIEGIRSRVIAGEPFARLVAELSDSSNKASGGLIGPLNFDDINPALKDIIAPLTVGEVTPPVRGTRGYQIFQLDNRSISEQKPLATVRDEIEQLLRDERIEPETRKLLTRLRAQAVIEWKDESYRKLYEQAVAAKTTP